MRSHSTAQVVLGAVGPGHGRRAGDRDGGVLHEVLREVGDAVVVRVRLVRLEHGELGAVRGVGTLVAEVAVDLEDTVESADHGALEEQLGRDAEVELGVERVGARHERARGCAAVLHLEHRRLDLDVAAVREGLAQRGVDLRAGADRLARLVADDQVEVAAAHAALFGELGVHVRQRQDGLRGDLPVRDHDRQLAAAARDDLAAHEDVIAEVDEVLPLLQRLLAHSGERDHRLDAAAVAGLQGREAQLAGVAAEDDAPGDGRRHSGLGAGLEVAVAARAAPGSCR